MNNQLVEIHLPIRSWAKLFRTLMISLLEKDHTCFEQRDRVDYDNSKCYEDIIECLVWNHITPALKYKFDNWDLDHYIGKLISGYAPTVIDDKVIRKGNGDKETVEEVYISDELSYWFTQGPLMRMENTIEDFFNEHNIGLPSWEIVELLNCDPTKVLRIGGDWRAREWCKEHNQEYDF